MDENHWKHFRTGSSNFGVIIAGHDFRDPPAHGALSRGINYGLL